MYDSESLLNFSVREVIVGVGEYEFEWLTLVLGAIKIGRAHV